MRPTRVVALTVAGLSLAGCGGLSLDWFSSSPPKPVNVMLDFDSDPKGAEAKTSIGPSCQTPCTLEIPIKDPFTVTFSHEGYAEQKVPVQIEKKEGAVTLSPNPVFAQLTSTKKKPAAKPAAKPAPKPAPAEGGSPSTSSNQ
jgi:hypothetical protein